MARGQHMPVGSTRISQNGYSYTKMEDMSWKLTHHIIAEETLGRLLHPHESAYFDDGDRTNLNPKNIKVRKKGQASLNKRLVTLYARRDEILAEIAEIEKTLKVRQSFTRSASSQG